MLIYVDMAAEDEVKMVGSSSASSSSFTVDSQLSDEKRDVLSPEDAAWVDSCLIKESDICESNWNSMKDALLEVLNSQPGLYNSSEPLSDERPKETDVKMLTLRDQSEADRYLAMEEETEEIPRSPFDLLRIKEEAESSSKNFPIEEVNDVQSLSFVGNPFLPSYIKGLKEAQTNALGSDLCSPVDEIEPSTNDIFRVWDLNVPTEENELGKQLKILEENDLQSKPSEAFANSGAGDNLKGESLEDIINAIANISLSRDSSS